MKKTFVYIILVSIIFETSFERLGLPIFGILDELFVLISFLYMLFSNGISFTKTSIKYFVFILLFFITGIASYYLNSHEEEMVKFAFLGGLLTVKFFLLVFSFMNIKVRKETIDYWLKALLNIAKYSSPFVVFSFLFPTLYGSLFPFVVYETPRLGFHGAVGLFYFPGLCGWFYCFIACYYLSEYHNKNRKKSMYMFIYFSLIAILSLKVKVILSILVITAIWILLFSKRNKFLNIFLGVTTGVGILASFSSIIMKNINLYILGVSETMDESARYALLDRSYMIAQDYFPFGVGFSKYGSWFARTNYSDYYYTYRLNNIYGLRIVDNAIYSTDTYWPQVIGETGIIGLVIVVTQFAYLMKKLISRLFFNKIEIEQKIIVTFTFFVMVQTLLESSAAAIFNTSPQFLLIAVLLGYSLSNNIFKEERGTNER